MIIYVTTRIEVTDGVDPQELISECDYEFKHPDIISTEITEVEESE
jgi:hypothetical protein